MANAGNFFVFIVSLFKQTLQFFQQINVKNVNFYPIYDAGIRTYDLSNMSCLP